MADEQLPPQQDTDVFFEAIDEITEAARFSLEENKHATRRKLRGFVAWVVEILNRQADTVAQLRARVEELESAATTPDEAETPREKSGGKASAKSGS